MESWLWTQKQDIGPSPRYYSSMAYDSSLKRVVLFGGYDGQGNRDTWEWNGNEWTQMADTGPSARHGHSCL
ncbi:MAG: kelch repeat-containing protein [Thermoproteota archaeon]|nr:kelch repeat-containing protein [Thermoproteota archaeon]